MAFCTEVLGKTGGCDRLLRMSAGVRRRPAMNFSTRSRRPPTAASASGSLGFVCDGIANQCARPAGRAQGVNVSVGGKDVLVDDPVPVAVDAGPAPHAKHQVAFPTGPSQHPGIVELVAANLGAGRVVWVFALHADDGVAMPLGALEQPEGHREDSGHRVALALYDQFLAQVHEAAALGIDRQPVIDHLPQPAAERRIGRQLRGMGLGKPAADVNSVELGQALVPERAHGNDLRPGRRQSLDVFRVVKLKRRILQDADAGQRGRACCPLTRCLVRIRWRAHAAQRWGFTGDAYEGLQIDVLGRDAGDGSDRVRRPAVLGGRHESHVALGKNLPVELGNRADHRDPAVVLDAPAQDRFVPRAGDPVEDHPADRHLRVEAHTAGDHRGHGACGFGAVQAHHHGCPQQLGQFGGAGGAVQVDAVVKTAVALDQGTIDTVAVGAERAPDGLGAQQEGVQIVAGPACRKGKPARIDVVRAFLERSSGISPGVQGRDRTDRQDRLAGTSSQGRDDHPREIRFARLH